MKIEITIFFICLGVVSSKLDVRKAEQVAGNRRLLRSVSEALEDLWGMEDMKNEFDYILADSEDSEEAVGALSISVGDKYEAMAESMEHKGPHTQARRHHAQADYERKNLPQHVWSKWARKEEDQARHYHHNEEIAVATSTHRRHKQKRKSHRHEKSVSSGKQKKSKRAPPYIPSREPYMGEDKDSSGRSIPHEIPRDVDAAGNPVSEEATGSESSSLLSEVGSPE